MRYLRPQIIALPLCVACHPDEGGTAILNVTPVNAEATERADTSSFDLTVTAGAESETQTVPLGGVASFQVPAGEVHIAAAGSWVREGNDTGGEGCDCTGSRELSVAGGDEVDVSLALDCLNCWAD